MKPQYINAELQVAGWPAARIAEALDVSRGAVSRVIHGTSRSRRIELEIARATGLPPTTLWPGRHVDVRRGRPRKAA